MNKRFIAFILVLLIAVGGVFAALPTASAAEAILTGSIGFTFSHGFKVGDLLYQSSATNTGNAFDDDPVLIYGFKAKNNTGFKSIMTVSSFKRSGSETDIVKISKVVITVDEVDEEYTTVIDSTEIEVLRYDEPNINKLSEQQATITIVPEESSDQPSGTYISELAINIKSL